MSCCGGGGFVPMGGNMNVMNGINPDCPNECCFLYKTMVDPCSKMLDRNVRRNVYGQVNCPRCPPPCPPPRPNCRGGCFSISSCCPAPNLVLCDPPPYEPCCEPMPPCQRKPAKPCQPKMCWAPPCCPDPCIKPSRKCYEIPPCCPPPTKKVALVGNPPICPACCPPLPCCPPDPCACAPPVGCTRDTCPGRPPRKFCPSNKVQSQDCSPPCCNPITPSCVIVKPCEPECPNNLFPVLPIVTCPDSNSCCPKPAVVSFKCPTSQFPLCPQQDDDCPTISPCLPLPQQSRQCPPKPNRTIPMSVKAMPTSNCPMQPSCNDNEDTCNSDPCNNDVSDSATPAIAPSKRLTKPRCTKSKICCRPKWDKTVVVKFPWRVHFNFAVLPPLSCRYKNWTSKIDSRTDHNLWASRFSCKKANQKLIAALPVAQNCDPCPCHCCPE